MAKPWSLRGKFSLAFTAVFSVALLCAMHSYAGGSFMHPHAAGFSWLENFWCDLLREPAYSGLPNGRSVALAGIAFAALALGLAPFWLELARLLPARRAALVRVAGLVSSVATALVALLPSDRYPHAHAPAVLTAGGLGFACGLVCAGFAVTHFKALPAFALSSVFLLAAASVNLVLYVNVIYFHGPDTVVLPLAQKLATVGLVSWIVAGLFASRRAPALR